MLPATPALLPTTCQFPVESVTSQPVTPEKLVFGWARVIDPPEGTPVVALNVVV